MEISPLFVGLVPIVIALVEVSKNYIVSKWSPIVALVLGIAGAALIGAGTETVPMIILQGIMIGAMAVGVYGGTKSVVK